MKPTLYLDKRHTTNGKDSHIEMDNSVAIHTFINKHLKALPLYANDAAAGAAGLVTGDLYRTTTSILFKL